MELSALDGRGLAATVTISEGNPNQIDQNQNTDHNFTANNQSQEQLKTSIGR